MTRLYNILYGFIALGYQMLVYRCISPYYGASPYTISLVSAMFIAGYLTGPFLATRLHRFRRPLLIATPVWLAVSLSSAMWVLPQSVSLPYFMGLGLITLAYGAVSQTLLSTLWYMQLPPLSDFDAFGWCGLGNILGALGFAWGLFPYLSLPLVFILWGVLTAVLMLHWAKSPASRFSCLAFFLLFAPQPQVLPKEIVESEITDRKSVV